MGYCPRASLVPILFDLLGGQRLFILCCEFASEPASPKLAAGRRRSMNMQTFKCRCERCGAATISLLRGADLPLARIGLDWPLNMPIN